MKKIKYCNSHFRKEGCFHHHYHSLIKLTSLQHCCVQMEIYKVIGSDVTLTGPSELLCVDVCTVVTAEKTLNVACS